LFLLDDEETVKGLLGEYFVKLFTSSLSDEDVFDMLDYQLLSAVASRTLVKMTNKENTIYSDAFNQEAYRLLPIFNYLIISHSKIGEHLSSLEHPIAKIEVVNGDVSQANVLDGLPEPIIIE
jgi:hypothetical protein